MKRQFVFTLMMFFSVAVFAQKDVTTFLGIPVDGTKTEMRKNLIAKGFTPKITNGLECFSGEFNGTDVNVYIGTNNNKVYRIMVCDANYIKEAAIKNRFNRLVSQFTNNKRYFSLFEDQTIPEDEDISYEMVVEKKTYEALFYQIPDYSKIDSLAVREKAYERMLEKYTEEQLQNPTEKMESDWNSITLDIGFELFSKKTVWFTISEFYGQYYITMYYDNGYNQANGEDL